MGSVFLPCGHFCCCTNCEDMVSFFFFLFLFISFFLLFASFKFFQSRLTFDSYQIQKCPMCRAPIQGKMKAFVNWTLPCCCDNKLLCNSWDDTPWQCSQKISLCFCQPLNIFESSYWTRRCTTVRDSEGQAIPCIGGSTGSSRKNVKSKQIVKISIFTKNKFSQLFLEEK